MGRYSDQQDECLSDELLALLGEDAVFALAEEYAGTRLYVPSKRLGDRHLIVRAIGREAADKLHERFGTATIRMPLMRDLRARRHRENGMSVQRIAVRRGMTENGVGRILKRLGATKRRPITGKRTDEQRRAKWERTVARSPEN